MLLGEPTLQTGPRHVEVEEVEPLALKGKSEPVPAYRLPRPRDRRPTARREAPLVGREDELARSWRLRGRRRDARASLVTIVADAGVGKSRLTRSSSERLGDRRARSRAAASPTATASRSGRSSSPREAAGIATTTTPGEARREASRGRRHAATMSRRRIAAMIGLDEPFPARGLFWAVRRLLEGLARERPLVLVVQDIHWAEPTLLELLEHLAAATTMRPLLVSAPRGPSSRIAALSGAPATGRRPIQLGPRRRCGKAMVESLLGGGSLDPGTLDRIVTAAQGNPLFGAAPHDAHRRGPLERERGVAATGDLSELHVPPTIQALLARASTR